MAPALIETAENGAEVVIQPAEKKKSGDLSFGPYKNPFGKYADDTNYAGELEGSDGHAPAAYPHYLPYWDEVTYPPIEPFEHTDRGKDADPAFPNLLASAKSRDLTANIGAEVTGVQISKLNDAGKNELARFVAEKKVVVFRDQDFADLPIQEALDFAEYYGPSHIHQTSGAPKGFPRVHLVHRSAADTTAKDFFEERTSSITWHTDVSFELQPPCTTFLYLLDGPVAGGDTLFANMAAAYRRLSPEFQKRLHGLKALHSGKEQAAAAKAKGSVYRREPIMTEHPVVRTHPVTGEKALYVNPQFTRKIVGYKKEESEYLLKFLYDHIAFGADFQVRMKWEKGSVILWDNRSTCHSAILDWEDGQRRHLARLTPQGERPYETPFDSN